MEDSELRNLTQNLIDNHCLKFGDFKLKSGISSNYYIDLRTSTYYPVLFSLLKEAIKKTIQKQSVAFRDEENIAITGVPYGVVPLAGAVASDLMLPYFPVRKETKNYGNKEGADENLMSEHKFIVIEDVMSTGSSIIETIKKLPDKKVTDVIVVVDRGAGGVDNIKSQYPNIQVHSILNASDMLVN